MKSLSTNRPKDFQSFVGQTHLFGTNAPLMQLILQKSMPHCFFYGPPGTGKTTAALLIAKELEKPFYSLNATCFKIEDLRDIVKRYYNTLQKPLIFIDEVHRLSKNQQEVLLPIMERNDILFIGASTENPFYTLTAALRSRSMLFEFYPLGYEELSSLLKGYHLEPQVRDFLITSSNGDARAMLNLLTCAINSGLSISVELLKSFRATSLNDGSSENETHYNLISALIKSIRGSDENAAVYYLARLIKGGENAEFIARRLVILASEDIGNANPNALSLATATLQAVSKIGYPEARIILSQCVIYLCASPKSNTAYVAINEALRAVERGEILEVPSNIKHNPKHYLYPHNFGGWVAQTYLSKPLKFVHWLPKGFEKTLMEWLEKIRGHKNE